MNIPTATLGRLFCLMMFSMSASRRLATSGGNRLLDVVAADDVTAEARRTKVQKNQNLTWGGIEVPLYDEGD